MISNGGDTLEIGKCHLCGNVDQLEDSHIWPSFAYKRFAANQAKGGQFIDLQKMTLSNKQYKRFWFCGACEDRLGKSEDWAARLCTRIANDPKAPQSYDVRLLDFAVSISWRVLKLVSESNGTRIRINVLRINDLRSTLTSIGFIEL